MASVLLTLSCGGSPKVSAAAGGADPSLGLPVPPNPFLPASVNAYIGTQASSPSHTTGKIWSVSLDHTKDQYSYADGGNTAQSGSFVPMNGYLLLLDKNGYEKGFALEVQGRAVIIRPGDSSAAPVFAIQQPTCFPIKGNVKFQFVMSPGDPTAGQATFGKIYATTDSSGSEWDFAGQAQYQAPDGKNVPTNAYIPSYPSSFSGNCQASPGAASINISATPEYSTPTQYVIGPTGYFLETRSYANDPNLSQFGDISAWGISEPSVALSTSKVASASYLGFLFEANGGTYLTRPVGFGGTTTSGTVMSGGTFLNENPINPQGTEMTLSFGSQDPLNHGSYYLAKLVLPLAPNSSCASTGTDANGNQTCTYAAVATVGNPEGKYFVILTAYDSSGHQKILILVQQ
jgi:hypothetical protein